MQKRAPTPFLETFAGVKRRLTGVVDEAYGRVGIGATQGKLLRAVGDHQPMSQADLARATGTDPAMTGRALRTLLDRGWVRRRRSREDKRAFSLELTPEGEVLLTKVREARQALMARVDEHLDARDLAAFERIARKLLEAFPE